MTVKHNVIKITSLDMFFDITGRRTGEVKEVLFVRALGEYPDYCGKIEALEQKLLAAGAKYIRIHRLPVLSEPSKVQKYSGIYDAFKQGADLLLEGSQELKNAIGSALSDTEQVYMRLKKNTSASMLRNFGIKLLYWYDELTKGCFEAWGPDANIKISLVNAIKEQEYLFGYFLTLLGADVLLLNNGADTVAGQELSLPVKLGAFGKSILPEYKEKVLEVRKNTPVSIVHPARKNTPVSTVHPARKDTGSQAQKPITKTAPALRTEKNYEELAKLASSIVMLAIHDANGEVEGTGSGIMIGREGYILTNFHVVSKGRFYSVRLEDDENIYQTDELIKYNQATDLAIIRIDKRLKPLPIYDGREALVRGQKVVAIGSPLGFFNSVSDGIISGFRTINNNDMIQFTAPTSPGSSGGAVLNMYGEVIGISTAGMDNAQNINLAVGYESIRSFAGGFI